MTSKVSRANSVRAYLRRFLTEWCVPAEAYSSNLDQLDGVR